MKNIITIEARRFPVTLDDYSTDHIILSKEQLQAAQIVGQSSLELIGRIYKRQGYEVFDIGKAEKKTISLDLEKLWEVDE